VATRGGRLWSLIARTPEVIEAHLPQAFVTGAMKVPAQVLVIVVRDPDVQRAVEKIGSGLTRILPSGRHMDVWPMSPSDGLLPSVRGADCRVG